MGSMMAPITTPPLRAQRSRLPETQSMQQIQTTLGTISTKFYESLFSPQSKGRLSARALPHRYRMVVSPSSVLWAPAGPELRHQRDKSTLANLTYVSSLRHAQPKR